MKDATRQNIVWMDWAKIIGIYLVVFCHLLNGTNNGKYSELHELYNIIYLFHMPLFFLLSGFMYKRRPGITGITRIVKTLVIPYLIYQFTFLIIRLMMYIDDGINEKLILKHIVGILLGDGYDTSISKHTCLPCWFIVCIIQLRLIFQFLSISKNVSVLLCFFSPVILILLKQLKIDLFGCLDTTLMAIPYFIIGYLIKEYKIVSFLRLSGGGILCFG